MTHRALLLRESKSDVVTVVMVKMVIFDREHGYFAHYI